ncbi:hypothetical protein D9M69_642280 [compost metagenome]
MRMSGAMFGKTGQISDHHSCDQCNLGVRVDLNKAAGMKTGFGKLDTEVEPAVSGAEGYTLSQPCKVMWMAADEQIMQALVGHIRFCRQHMAYVGD